MDARRDTGAVLAMGHLGGGNYVLFLLFLVPTFFLFPTRPPRNARADARREVVQSESLSTSAFAKPRASVSGRASLSRIFKNGFAFKENGRRHRRLLRPGVCVLKYVTIANFQSCSTRFVVAIGVFATPGRLCPKGRLNSYATAQRKTRRCGKQRALNLMRTSY